MMITDYTPNQYAGFTEHTLLKPYEDTITVDVWLRDVKHLQQKNGYAEIYFTFNPTTSYDDMRIEEGMEQAVSKVEMRKEQYSRKQATKQFKDKGKNYYCSQLFIPKLTSALERVEDLEGLTASLKLHFRDDHDGNVYLQCDYVDVYDPSNGIDNDTFEDDPKGDYDF